MGDEDHGAGGIFGSAGDAAAFDICLLEKVAMRELDSFKRILKP